MNTIPQSIPNPDYLTDQHPILNNIPLNRSNSHFLNKVARFLLANEGVFSEHEVNVLVYMGMYNVNGVYRCLSGRRIELCERLSISKGTYERTIEKLRAKKLIKYVRFKDNYIGYELPSCFMMDKVTFTVVK